MAGIEGQGDRAIVEPVARGIAPAVCGFERFTTAKMQHLVGPVIKLTELPAAHGAFAIALALEMGAAVLTQQAGKAQAANFQHPTG